MSVSDWPIAVSTATDICSAGVRLWRQRQQLFATVAVKATFSLAPKAAMTLRAPLPLECNERPGVKSEGVEPGDLAPCLLQPEIWVRGHAWYPPALGAPSVRVRLLVARDATPLLRKSVEIPLQTGSSVPPFLHPFGPLSGTWPIRTRHLGSVDPAMLDRSPLDLPDVFDWNYFQAAPADQRLGPLRGDEWIRLEGIHPTIFQFDTRLPMASCAVVLFGQMEPLRQGSPVRVGLDTIQIDSDHGWCALLFRGHVQLPAGAALDDLEFVAAIGLPDRPFPRLEPQFLSRSKSTPPSPINTPSVSARPAVVTRVLDASMLNAAAEKQALPFQEAASRFPSSIPPPIAIATEMPRDRSLGETMVLDVVPPPAIDEVAKASTPAGETHEKAAPGPATPFTRSVTLPPPDDVPDSQSVLPFRMVLPDEQPTGTLGAIFLKAMEAFKQGTGQTSWRT